MQEMQNYYSFAMHSKLTTNPQQIEVVKFGQQNMKLVKTSLQPDQNAQHKTVLPYILNLFNFGKSMLFHNYLNDDF